MVAALDLLRAPQHGYADEAELNEDYHRRGWTDGLPVMAPTPDRVAAFLDRVDLAPDAPIGIVRTRDIEIVAEHVAINAVMAGCKVDYMPVVLAAARAMLRDEANLHCVTATLVGAQQGIIINGPARAQLDVNCGLGCFGPGWRANATIGRALRLFLRNAAYSIPGLLDRAIFSAPGRFGFCFGENEEASPWAPLHVTRGFAAEESTVSVFSMQQPTEIVCATLTPQAVLDEYLIYLRNHPLLWVPVIGMNDRAELIVAMSPDHAAIFAGAGWSLDDTRAYIWERIVGTLSQRGFAAGSPLRVQGPEDIYFIVAGGNGHYASWYFQPHCSLMVTERIVGL